MAKDGYVRFRGLAKKSNGANAELISRTTGYSFVKDGDDLVIPSDDAQLQQGPPPILRAEEKPLSLSRPNHKDVAELYVNHYLIPSLDAGMVVEREPYIPDNLGMLSRISHIRYNFFFTNSLQLLKARLVTEILPFMTEEMEAKHVFPVAAHATLQQGLISLHKIAAGIAQFGAEALSARLEQHKIYTALLPTPSSISTYPEALLIFSPLAISIPLSKVCSHLHFMSQNVWHFDQLATQGVFETLASDHNPVPVTLHDDFLHLYEIQAYSARKYLVQCIKAVNSLMSWLNNPLSFVDKDGLLNHVAALQAQGAVHLMFSDLVAINFTNNSYSKIRHVMSFLDKLANLKVSFTGTKTRNAESEAFVSFFSSTFGRSLAGMLSHHLGPVNEKLGKCLSRAVLTLYDKLAAGETIFRAVRNTHHGAYLSGEQFQQIFFSDYEIPVEISYLPLFLMWGLMLDHERFLRLEMSPG